MIKITLGQDDAFVDVELWFDHYNKEVLGEKVYLLKYTAINEGYVVAENHDLQVSVKDDGIVHLGSCALQVVENDMIKQQKPKSWFSVVDNISGGSGPR